jgi:CopG family nickel-responsive transcriptional regulator
MLHRRHEHEDLVASNFHSYVGEHHCMKLFILEGSLQDISTFVGQLRATQNTLTVDTSPLALSARTHLTIHDPSRHPVSTGLRSRRRM